MKNIEIRISGDRGVGKTLTAIRLVRFLRTLGMDVTYHGYSAEQEREINRLIDCKLQPRGFDFRTIDVFDNER